MPYRSFDWKRLRLTPVNIYEGKPLWREVFLPRAANAVVEFWLQLSGSVRVTNKSLRAKATASEYMVCLPGARLQRCSPDARIRSVHFVLEGTGGMACWRGPHLVGLPPNEQLSERLARFFDDAKADALCDKQWKKDQRIEASLPSWLGLQANLHSLVAVLLPVLESSGVFFDPAPERETCIEEGVRWLSRKPIHYAFDRCEFAGASGLGPSQVDRIWRRERKQTPRQYWEERRLGWACRKLALDNVSIKEVAFEMGFAHLSQFSAWFKRHTGRSPREYRENVPASIG